MFQIGIQDRIYDLHRPKGCTVLTIEVEHWPGNEFGLWLPETVWVNNQIAWCNWSEDAHQSWERQDGKYLWRKHLGKTEIVSALRPDPDNSSLWYSHSFTSLSNEVLSGLQTQTCLHLVNAPQFISVKGERIWACLDGAWTTTDKVPRQESPDTRRVSFLRKGIRSERTVVPSKGFPSALMPEQAHHPLLIAENFDGSGAVGIACRNWRSLFNNNDCILRCIHSEPHAVESLVPGATAAQEGVIAFCRGDHQALSAHFEAIVPQEWLVGV
jgi:hypothetical protein